MNEMSFHIAKQSFHSYDLRIEHLKTRTHEFACICLLMSRLSIYLGKLFLTMCPVSSLLYIIRQGQCANQLFETNTSFVLGVLFTVDRKITNAPLAVSTESNSTKCMILFENVCDVFLSGRLFIVHTSCFHFDVLSFNAQPNSLCQTPTFLCV